MNKKTQKYGDQEKLQKTNIKENEWMEKNIKCKETKKMVEGT